MDTNKVERISKEYWMNSHLSIARFSGGCRINGVRYILNHQTEELVREDIFRKDAKAEKDAKRKEAAKARVGSQTEPE